MSSCNLPQDLIVQILSRLPVKSLLRFKSVSKPWLALTMNPTFISLHLTHTDMNPKNDAVIIHSLSLRHDHIMSLCNVNPIDNKPINLDHPFPEIFLQMDLVGSCNGLVCLGCPPLGQMIILWNPATRMYKTIRLPSTKMDRGEVDKVSLGLGFDPVENDYKIVRIMCMTPKKPKKIQVKVQVYSVNRDSWKVIQDETPFYLIQTRCNAIAKGIPYWTAFIESEKSEFHEVLLFFDTQKEVFLQGAVPNFPMGEGTNARLVELKDGLASLVYYLSEESNKGAGVDVWVLDDCKKSWSKKFSVGPIPFKVERLIQCSKNGEIVAEGTGEIVAEGTEGKLFLYDPKTNGIKNISIDKVQAHSYEAFSYTESLVSIKGMKQVGL
ncbi:unnamed protein product [Ilex paraguariensis]|uniref:F-box domain-containing protein n=1 Tax=Ilex paraguariensis TaxID=185542 RepID=A0ABC8RE41_9AQUA